MDDEDPATLVQPLIVTLSRDEPVQLPTKGLVISPLLLVQHNQVHLDQPLPPVGVGRKQFAQEGQGLFAMCTHKHDGVVSR